jgi:hypothetical protein
MNELAKQFGYYYFMIKINDVYPISFIRNSIILDYNFNANFITNNSSVISVILVTQWKD